MFSQLEMHEDANDKCKRPPGNPQPTENYKLVKFLSEVPVSAVNTLHFQTTSTLPGISMTQLLHQSVAAADAENAFSLHEKHPLIRLVCRVRTYFTNLSLLTCSSRPLAMQI